MDNMKTGELIKAIRKEKGLTQKTLAIKLGITDRAVSKWERGLNAPDISLLEPLSEILDITVLELIKGERTEKQENSVDADVSSKHLIAYSRQQIKNKVKKVRTKTMLITAIIGCVLGIFLFLIFINAGYPYVIDKKISPDGRYEITVYRKTLDGSDFSMCDGVSLIVREKGTDLSWRVTYGDKVEYQDVNWAPDGKKYVLSLKNGESTQLALTNLEYNSETNLSAVLSFGVEMTELKRYGYAEKSGFPDIEYQFLQWGLDSESMLIYYEFEDKDKELHQGYFWYNYKNGKVKAILEMQP